MSTTSSSVPAGLPTGLGDVDGPVHGQVVRAPGGIQARSGHLSRTSRRWQIGTLALDVAVITVGAVLSQRVTAQGAEQRLSGATLVLFVLATLGLLACARLYAPRLSAAVVDDVAMCVGATAVASMIAVVVQPVFGGSLGGSGATVRLWAFTATYLAAARTGLLLAQRSMRRAGEGVERTLIVGAGHVGQLVAKRLGDRPDLGLLPIGYLDKEPLEHAPGEPGTSRVLGASWDLERIVERERVEHVVLAFSNAPHSVLLDLVRRCEEMGLRVSVVPRLFERMTSRVDVTHVGGLPLLELRPVSPRGVQYATKYVFDRMFAAAAIVLLSPVFLATALAVLLSLGRPVLFRQRRVGCDGREFDLLKFRTMRPALDSPGIEFSSEIAPGGIEGDDRRTAVGAFLRKYSIDELPQLLNVLRGDMSVVGPRPERPEFVRFFNDNVYRYGERHRVKGGLTGWSQIHGLRGKSSIVDRVEWDNYYIENYSLWLDFKIALRTIPVVVKGVTSE